MEKRIMSVTFDEQVSLRTAYLIAHIFATRYWERGNKQDELTSFIIDTEPALQDQTVDPAQIGDWLNAAEEVLTKRCAWGDLEHEAGEAPA